MNLVHVRPVWLDRLAFLCGVPALALCLIAASAHAAEEAGPVPTYWVPYDDTRHGEDLTPSEFEKAWRVIVAQHVSGADEAAMTRVATDRVLRVFKQDYGLVVQGSPKDGHSVIELVEGIRHRQGDGAPETLLYKPALEAVLRSLGDGNRIDSVEIYRGSPDARAAIGLRAAIRDAKVIVVTAIAGASAQRAGVKAGDRIVSVDGAPATPDLRAFMNRLTGEGGSTVALTVERKGAAGPIKLVVQREILRDPAIEVTEAGAVLRLRIPALPETIARRVTAAVVMRQAVAPAKSIYILDLRGNSGGLLPEAAAVADVFLGGGDIGMVRGSAGERTFKAGPADAAEGRPLIVLIDGLTTTGGEIIAAALKENGRALVIGSKSYGAGTSQSVTPLNSQDVLTLTTGYLYTASGDPLDKRGVTPDVITSSDSDRNPQVSPEFAGRAGFDRTLLLAAAEDRTDVSADLAALGTWDGDNDLAYAVRLSRLIP
jgi:carboxyl-terminal processing protease